MLQSLVVGYVVCGISDEIQIGRSGAVLLMRFEESFDLKMKVPKPSEAAFNQQCHFTTF